jgi:hypothetical protein
LRSADRIRHHLGERLTAADLTEASTYESWLRAVHVRALHDTWGVALGFDLGWAASPEVPIGPGLAYDACAGEILLSQPTTLSLPAFEDGAQFDLVCRRGRAGPEFRWIGAGDPPARTGIEIDLGTYLVIELIIGIGIRLLLAYPSYPRRNMARSAIRPVMDTGVVEAGEAAWERLGEPCVYTTLTTDRSGFTAQPQYQAWLLDNPWAKHGELPPVVSVDQIGGSRYLQLTFLADFGEDKVTERLADASLVWFAIEPISGLWPTLVQPEPADPQLRSALGRLATARLPADQVLAARAHAAEVEAEFEAEAESQAAEEEPE